MQKFEETVCSEYDTGHLPRKEAAKERRAAAGNANPRSATGSTTSKAKLIKEQRSQTTKVKFNLNFPKFHLLGHYAPVIVRVGTSDNYTTQTVRTTHFIHNLFLTVDKGELEHHVMKENLYPCAAKQGFKAGIGKQHLYQC